MIRNSKHKKILILGSGALKIGEAGEFDYSGSQAIKALKEEGIKTVLINPNIATIQTSKLLADTVYFLPVTDYFVEKVIEKEKPDGILLSFGGQTALNCGVSLYKKGILKKHNIEILGNPMNAIIVAEDRQKFADHLRKMGIKTPESHVAGNEKQAFKIAKEIGFPVMVRSGFALGGQGSGIAKNEEELRSICKKTFAFVKQILVEKYLHHFKEIEYEVVRDKYDNCVTVCNMENMDPLGIHTGESIVVAPSQTLTNYEYHFLRLKAIEIVRSLKVVGECNVQFALNPDPKGEALRVKGKEKNASRFTLFPSPLIDYYVIEMNPRLSRSSALASKATGYPLAYVAAKLALGKSLTEIKNKVTQFTQSCFEPALDYIVVKIPRWDIEKFKGADEKIGSSMKSVGEVMGIGRTFEEAFQKAIRMLDLDFQGATDTTLLANAHGKSTEELLRVPTPKRMFAIAKALHQKMSVAEIYKLTGIDPWFLSRIENIVTTENKTPNNIKKLDKKHLLNLKQLGVSDKRIGEFMKVSGLTIRALRKKWRVVPSVFKIDTLAAEFPAKTNYLYLTYNGSHNDIKPSKKEGVIVLGSGPYRIGSSVEFDWTSVNTVLNLKSHNKKSIIINCNPETVSTDYDISDRLYFEELTFERIADIYDFENPFGIILSVGGQTPNNRAKGLNAYGAHILGTSSKNIDRAENRNTFSKLCDTLDIAQPSWNTFTKIDSAIFFAKKVGFPVLIRPSYVLSGTLMRICHTEKELKTFLTQAANISKEYPITISKFIENAKEIEFDGVSNNGRVLAFVITEHVENAGVHSGDATIILPPQNISKETEEKIKDIAKKLSKELEITGPFNIQFLAKDNTIQVIEINLRASRTFPFISKVTGVDFIKLTVDSFFSSKGRSTSGRNNLVINQPNFVAIKVPQFSFARLTGADPILHVEMASTGEVACFGEDIEEAFLKGELSVGGKIPQKGIFISLGGEENKIGFLESTKQLTKLKLPLYATEKTHQFLKNNNITSRKLYKLHEKKTPNVLDFFRKGKVDLAINFVEHQIADEKDQYTIRRAAIDFNIHLFTNLQKAALYVKAITTKKPKDLLIKSWDEYQNGEKETIIRGKVKKGKKRGKRLGFPTANISIKETLKEGVYLSVTTIENKKFPALTFIGKALTFNETVYQSETHILHSNKKLYDKELSIQLIKKIRGNKKFDSEEELIDQMKKDKKEAEEYFSNT